MTDLTLVRRAADEFREGRCSEKDFHFLVALTAYRDEVADVASLAEAALLPLPVVESILADAAGHRRQERDRGPAVR